MEMARFYGCGVNAKALRNFMFREVNPEVGLVKSVLDKGQDPPELIYGSKDSKGQSHIESHVFLLLYGFTSCFMGSVKTPIEISRSTSAQPSWCESE